MKQSYLIWVFLFSLLSCETNVHVYAPEKEMYAVVGILNPKKDEQFIKVSSVFQFEGDVYEYGATQDFSVKGLTITLEGEGKIWTATERDDVAREQGIFAPWHTLYSFDTGDSNALKPYVKYKLTIWKPGLDEPVITSETTIPGEPVVISPLGPVHFISGLYMNPSLSFNDGFSVVFERPGGFGFELRAYVDYFEGSEMKTATWGPTPLFKECVNCFEGDPDRICYYIQPNDVLRSIATVTQTATDTIFFDDGPDYSFDRSELNTNVRIESTSIDSFLTNYMTAENPFGYGDNLLMDKKNWTNIKGGIGIFGSIHTALTFVRISDCDEYLAGLTSSHIPPANCEW